MLRKLLALFGLIEIVAPKPVIDICERIGLENPEDAQLRPGALVIARMEGVIFVTLLGRGREPVLSKLLTVAGIIAVVYPRPVIRASQSVAYTNSSELVLRRWIEPATRLLGVLYLGVVFLSGRSENEVRMGERDGDRTY